MKSFIIYLESRPHSVAHANYMMSTLHSYGLDVELFNGIPGDQALKHIKKDHRILYPYGIKTKQLSDNDLRDIIQPEIYEKFLTQYHYTITERMPISSDEMLKLSRPGVIGCFYSHYYLWKKCLALNEPIMIFEDDVKFYRGWHPVEFDDVLILSLGKSSYLSDPQRSYLECPTGVPIARKWQNFSMPGASGYAITPSAAQKLIKKYKKYWTAADNAINQFVCSLQISTYLMGRNTLPEEGNVSMTKHRDWI